MEKIIKHYITINNKKYFYTIKTLNKKITFVKCEGANLAQEFLNEDIPSLLSDLPNLILAEKEYKHKQDQIIRFRVSPEDRKLIEKKASKKGYSSISSFLRDLALGSS